MATEVERVEYGMTDKGQVVMTRLEHYHDNGEGKYFSYLVKHGVRTIGEYNHEIWKLPTIPALPV